jgi:hypothetical protein
MMLLTLEETSAGLWLMQSNRSDCQRDRLAPSTCGKESRVKSNFTGPYSMVSSDDKLRDTIRFPSLGKPDNRNGHVRVRCAFSLSGPKAA